MSKRNLLFGAALVIGCTGVMEIVKYDIEKKSNDGYKEYCRKEGIVDHDDMNDIVSSSC